MSVVVEKVSSSSLTCMQNVLMKFLADLLYTTERGAMYGKHD